MARKFQFKRGLKAQLPTLAAGEPGWVTDEGKLYIGTGSGNVPVARGDHTHTAAEVSSRPSTWTPTWSEVQSKPTTFTPTAHTHAPADLTSAVPLTKGGTGATTAAAALSALGGIPSTQKGAADGVATLDGNGRVTEAQLLRLGGNLLDNAWFADPFVVNQRGKTTYSEAWEYCIDRWVPVGTFDVALRKFTPSVAYGRIFQTVDSVSVLGGKTVILSADVANGSGGGAIFLTQTLSSVQKDFIAPIPANFSGIVSVTATLNAGISELLAGVLVDAPGNSIVINKIKLELGPVSTLHLDTPPSPTEQELNRQACKWYYRLWSGTDGATYRQQALREVGLMRLASPSTGTITIGGATYYYASADL